MDMMVMLAAVAALAGASLVVAPGDEVDVEVRTTAGTVRGAPRDARGVLVYKGIPYAQPPVGDLRWRAPQPPKPAAGIIDATQFGARCLSTMKKDPTPGPPRSEDCLTLNVWSGAKHSNERRPVMVWIHGGGFQFGSSAESASDGAALAAKGVVVVSFNYRLGVLGFLAHPGLDVEGRSGNYGLQDQIAALTWVKNNIAAFGGDPGNVTLFGESAGAHSVGLLLASPLANGLVHKAIGQSGAFWDSEHGSLSTRAEARERGVAYAQKLAGGDLAALRAMPVDQLYAGLNWDFTMDPGVTSFSPSIDGYVVPDVPAARYLARQQADIPLLAGWNGVEEQLFLARALPHASAEEFRKAAAERFGADHMAEFLALYPASNDAEAAASAAALVGDQVISEQTWAWLGLASTQGSAPVFGYYFTYTSPYVPVAAHTVDVAFVFGTLTPQRVVGSTAPAGAADRAMSDQMMAYWVNFATRGDPNGPGLPEWPSFRLNGAVLNIAAQSQSVGVSHRERFAFLERYRKAGALPEGWR